MQKTADFERMRAVCRALDPDFTEGPHYGSTVFKTRGKIFASFGDKNGIVVQLEPKHAAKLLASDDRFEAYPRARHTVMFDPASLKWTEIRALVAESFGLVPKTKTKTKKSTKKR